MKILIADDDQVSRRLLEGTLVRLGHEVVSVTDGNEAAAVLRRPDGPRMAILDWIMPGMDGLAVCHEVRQRAAPYVYIILLTARDRLEDRTQALEAEADEFLTKPLDTLELRARLRSGERVLKVQEQLLHAQEALRFEATYDRLTGLWRRGMIVDQLERELHRAKREGRPLSIVLVDLDHFKSVNDAHGHAAGDAVLKETAHRIRNALRGHDYLGRYGGEEFLLVLTGCDQRRAIQVAERVRTAVEADPVPFGGIDLHVTLSVGVGWTQTGEEQPSALIQSADAALYRAKARGRNRVET